MDLYAPLLWAWGQAAGLGQSDLADLVQEVLLILLRELPEFEYDPRRGRFRSWLKTIAVNKCREHQRRRRPGALSAADVPESSADREEFWEDEYRQHLVGRALELMQRDFAPNTWQACQLLIVSDQTAAEIGAALGMSEAAVYAAKSRVLRRLRTELEGLLD